MFIEDHNKIVFNHLMFYYCHVKWFYYFTTELCLTAQFDVYSLRCTKHLNPQHFAVVHVWVRRNRRIQEIGKRYMYTKRKPDHVPGKEKKRKKERLFRRTLISKEKQNKSAATCICPLLSVEHDHLMYTLRYFCPLNINKQSARCGADNNVKCLKVWSVLYQPFTTIVVFYLL